MKNELVKGLIIKTPTHHNKSLSNKKYIPSKKRIEALEVAYQKKRSAKVLMTEEVN